jgi:hypothetical protein
MKKVTPWQNRSDTAGINLSGKKSGRNRGRKTVLNSTLQPRLTLMSNQTSPCVHKIYSWMKRHVCVLGSGHQSMTAARNASPLGWETTQKSSRSRAGSSSISASQLHNSVTARATASAVTLRGDSLSKGRENVWRARSDDELGESRRVLRV